MSKNKLAFIGPENIHNAFKTFDDNWDMQFPITSLDALEDELSEDNPSPKLSKNTDVIIFFSRLYMNDKEQFAELVAYYAPYAVATILIPEGEIALYKEEIENSIRKAQIDNAREDTDYNINTPFYFVTYERAKPELLSAISSFCKSPYISSDTKEVISRMLPDYELNHIQENEETYEEIRDDDEIVIPAAHPDAIGKVITVTSSKGGSGKSTVAMSIANYISLGSRVAADKGIGDALRVIVIDLDVRDGQLGFINGINSPNIVDIMSSSYYNSDKLTIQAIKEGIWTNEKTKVDYIFASKRPRNSIEIPAYLYAEIIQELRSLYDYIILDTSVNYLDPLLEEVAYPIADKIVFVTDMGISSIFGMLRWISENIYSNSTKFKVDEDKVGIVVNKAIKDVDMEPEKILKASKGLPIIGIVPSAPQLITYSANTLSIEKILTSPGINEAIFDIVSAIIEPEDTIEEVQI